ncbi:DUF2235 domain-containing protein [Vibrio sp. RE86]|uniref:T6SS phospholipase effector Tle1-like catalytic domain-containing protein n=1 Tax=Vibrio sp. RE86 TaxID=2607605 RepID=UPI001493DBA3|nr:DUF2235 domain-containing protein [Vibrio sp. RE86]
MTKVLFFFLPLFILLGCSTPTPVTYNYSQSASNCSSNNKSECTPKNIVIFFDGTANDETSRTNVKEMESLLHLYGKGNYASFYVEGVGVGGKIIGGTTGWGAAYRIRQAYTYLLNNHNPGDKIYIFGFSRGAYQARILTSMIRFAGIPDVETLNVSSSKAADEIYSSYKGKFEPESKRKDEVYKTLNQLGAELPDYDNPIKITALGLWDTVEAYGWLDGEDNVDEPNNRYGDQLCNVENAFHAVSLDDNRATVFTPLLLTRKHLIQECSEQQKVDLNLKEVWFSGAHSDVGGGYNQSRMNASSLKWMLSELTDETNFTEQPLFPSFVADINTSVLDTSHNPRSTWYFRLAYKYQPRTPVKYFNQENSTQPDLIYIHRSVLERITQCNNKSASCAFKAAHELDLNKEFGQCFTYDETRGQFDVAADIESCKIRIIEW